MTKLPTPRSGGSLPPRARTPSPLLIAEGTGFQISELAVWPVAWTQLARLGGNALRACAVRLCLVGASGVASRVCAHFASSVVMARRGCFTRSSPMKQGPAERKTGSFLTVIGICPLAAIRDCRRRPWRSRSVTGHREHGPLVATDAWSRCVVACRIGWVAVESPAGRASSLLAASAGPVDACGAQGRKGCSMPAL
jgi:hypothetical protein